VQPVRIATWIEMSGRELAARSVKQRLAVLRRLFDWLVTVVPVNPALTLRGPRHVVTSGQTPVLDPAEARAMLDSIDTGTVAVCATGADRADGLFLRPHRNRARHGSARYLHAEATGLGAAAREG
jgi:site-specific recombinase XerC